MLLSSVCDDTASTFDRQAFINLVGDLLGRIPILGVVDDTLGQDPGADHDRLTGYLSRNPFNVSALRPVYLDIFHASLLG
jgi:hypothetical protein